MTRRARQEQTRARLLTAAVRVFARRGYQGATVPEIAAEAGVSTGAIYSNFDGKEALFHALVADEMRRGNEQRIADLDQALNVQDAAASAGHRWVSSIDQSRDSVLLLLELCLDAARGSASQAKVAEELGTVRKNIAAELARLQERIGEQLHAPPDELAAAIQALCYGYALQRLVDPESADPDVLISTLTHLVERA